MEPLLSTRFSFASINLIDHSIPHAPQLAGPLGMSYVLADIQLLSVNASAQKGAKP